MGIGIGPKEAGAKDDPNVKKEILIHGRVYDITKFIPRHPGGSIIKFLEDSD